MKTVVLAYHEIGCAGLEFLKQAGADITGVFTHEDDPTETLWFGSVAQRAKEYGLNVYAPERINDPEWVEVLRNCEPEILFSFYYRKLVSAKILAIPRRGCYNLHGSLLPRFRGRSPTNWAILLGEKKTGVTLHEMVVKADAGVIVGQKEVEIGEDDDARAVLMKQVEATRALLAEVYPLLVQGRAPAIVQDESLATKFGGRRPEDGAGRGSAQDARAGPAASADRLRAPGPARSLQTGRCCEGKAHFRGKHGQTGRNRQWSTALGAGRGPEWARLYREAGRRSRQRACDRRDGRLGDVCGQRQFRVA